MSEITYTVKEVLELYFDEMQKDIKDIKETGKDTSLKVGIQNGRVTKLESWCIEAQKILESQVKKNDAIDELKADVRSKWTGLLWAGSAVVFLGGTIILLSIMAIDNKIEKGIAQALANNVESVTIAK